jgi:two-component system chemotaxis response regulator CheY
MFYCGRLLRFPSRGFTFYGHLFVSTVLIVDDSPTIRRMVRVALGTLPDVSFREAGNGLEAIETLVVSPPDLVVLDLNMPDMHGLEVLAFVRAREAFKTLPIVILTTRGDESSRQAAIQGGATRFLTKPFAPRELAAEVGALLGAAAPSIGARAGERT